MILPSLAKTFFLLVLFSFGGGYGSMELIRSKVVTENSWMTNAEFTDIISIAEMTPGPLGINIASFVGTRTGGIPGTLCATISYVLPAVIVVGILSKVYFKYRNLNGVQGVLKGLRPAVAAMVLAAAITLTATAWWGGVSNIAKESTNYVAIPISIVMLILLRKKLIAPIPAILSSGIIGALLYFLLGVEA